MLRLAVGLWRWVALGIYGLGPRVERALGLKEYPAESIPANWPRGESVAGR